MASHLTVTTTSAGVSTSKGLNASAGLETGAGGGAGNVFAALLGVTEPPVAPDTGKSATTGLEFSLGNLVNLSLGFGEGEAGKNDDPEAIAAVIDAVVPIQDTLDSVPVLADIAESLAELQSRLAAGEPLDAEALKQLDAALTELAAALDVDLAALPSLSELTALATDIAPDDVSFAARLTAAFGPVAETLFSGAATADTDPALQLSSVIKSIGDKLAALLAALNSGDIGPEQLAQLELGAKADARIEAALARLVTPTVTIPTGDAAPLLATPGLKLTEPVLTGKPTEAIAAAAATVDVSAPANTANEPAKSESPLPTSVSADADAGNGEQTADRGNENAADKKPGEQRPAAIAAPIDKQPEPQNATQPAQTARVDAVAPPRVVQAGYQTSQQQLNLPQLAFELVRQVNDGNTRFQMRLDPPELGRIDVRLEIDKSGQVNARLTVEKAETLDLMQRDQRGLERALQQAGLDGAKTNLEFSLKQNPSGGQQGQDGGGRHPIFGDDAAADAVDTPPPTINLYRGSLTASGVNIIA